MFTTSGTTSRCTRAHRVRRWVAIASMAAVVALGATACLPAGSGSPPDATTSGVLAAMNRDRAANGLGALAWDNRLAGNGSSWAAHLAEVDGVLVHQNLTDLLNAPGYESYNTLGENLLVGSDTLSPDEMEAAWMASTGHRANILRGAFTVAGVGDAIANGRIWVAVEFGG